MIDNFSPALPHPSAPHRSSARARDSAWVYLQMLPALSLMNNLPAAVVAFDRAGVIGYANHAFVAMLGHRSAEQLRGVPLNELAGVDSRCILPADQVELLAYRAGSITTWRHTCGHEVCTIASPMMRLRAFDPLAVMVLTEVAPQLAQLVAEQLDPQHR